MWMKPNPLTDFVSCLLRLMEGETSGPTYAGDHKGEKVKREFASPRVANVKLVAL